jgi:hypothetical protein
MKRNDEVIESWLAGRAASSGRMRTDGTRLYSYNLMIGERTDEGNVVFDYTASGIYYSQTTSCHVGLAQSYSGTRLTAPIQ